MDNSDFRLLGVTKVFHSPAGSVAKRTLQLSDGKLVSVQINFKSNPKMQKSNLDAQFQRIALQINHLYRGSPPEQRYSLEDLGLASGDFSTTSKAPTIVVKPLPTTNMNLLDADKLRHQFIEESPAFFNAFLDELKERFPEKAESIEEIRGQTMERFKAIYDKNYENWRRHSLSFDEAAKEWSSSEETKRQKESTKLFLEGMYDALYLAGEDAGQTLRKHTQVTSGIAGLHKDICQALAEKSKAQVSTEGAISIKHAFVVYADQVAKQPIMVEVATNQHGQILRSIDRRDGDKGRPVNAHNETVSFQPLQGESVTSTKLRTGSFDFYDTSIEEAEAFDRDRIIRDKNKAVILSTFNPEAVQRLGMSLPPIVADVYNSDIKLREKGLGMISLQTPVNLRSGLGINKLIRSVAESTWMPSFVKNIALQLHDPDLSELQYIHREMEAFKEVGDAKKPSKWLYFNIPTNFMGRTSRINIGPFSIPFRPSGFFNQGPVDKAREKEIMETTEKSATTVYKRADLAIMLLKNRLRGLQPTDPNYQTLSRFIHSLESLKEQTFKRDAQGRVSLVLAPEKGNYETVGRLTVLMEMLNMGTTGHCRSGNNRTAAWLAKSHQLHGAIVGSQDGRLPPPETTAVVLEKNSTAVEDRHWTLPVYLKTFTNSLHLQSTNKGTRGTKEQDMTIANKALRTAILTGGFELADKFSPKQMEAAKKRRSK